MHEVFLQLLDSKYIANINYILHYVCTIGKYESWMIQPSLVRVDNLIIN